MRRVAELSGRDCPRDAARPQAGPAKARRQARQDPLVRTPERSSGLPLADAPALVTEAATRLWTPEGTEALAYLHGRGLTDETIRAARLGWTPVWMPTRRGTAAIEPGGWSSRGSMGTG